MTDYSWRWAPQGAPVAQRLLAMSGEPDANGCWIWRAGVSRDGYGRLKIRSCHVGAHRAAYETWVGPIPGDMTVDHICFTRACVNPAHLRLLTNEANARRQLSAERPECTYGHPFSGDNLRVNRQRVCRTCERRRGAEYRARKRARKQAA